MKKGFKHSQETKDKMKSAPRRKLTDEEKAVKSAQMKEVWAKRQQEIAELRKLVTEKKNAALSSRYSTDDFKADFFKAPDKEAFLANATLYLDGPDLQLPYFAWNDKIDSLGCSMVRNSGIERAIVAWMAGKAGFEIDEHGSVVITPRMQLYHDIHHSYNHCEEDDAYKEAVVVMSDAEFDAHEALFTSDPVEYKREIHRLIKKFLDIHKA